MRRIAFAPVFLLVGSFAVADAAAPIDLDRPGVLHQLRRDQPQRYAAVSAVLRASERAPCEENEIELLEARYELKDLDCGTMVITTFPARRHVSFEVQGTRYAATVVLEDTDTVRPLTTGAELPATR
jgi:hypothetical protein